MAGGVARVVAHVDGGHFGDVEGVVLSEVLHRVRKTTRLASLLSSWEAEPTLPLFQENRSPAAEPPCSARAACRARPAWAAGTPSLSRAVGPDLVDPLKACSALPVRRGWKTFQLLPLAF